MDATDPGVPTTIAELRTAGYSGDFAIEIGTIPSSLLCLDQQAERIEDRHIDHLLNVVVGGSPAVRSGFAERISGAWCALATSERNALGRAPPSVNVLRPRMDLPAQMWTTRSTPGQVLTMICRCR